MQTELIIAIAAGGFSLLATALSVLANGRIARRNDEASARRAYEYEALKRLYAEVEPLLFQVESAAAGARDRAVNLARAARQGALEGAGHWLRDEGYYLASTLHALVRPAVYYRLLERRITSIDLSLDPNKAIVFALLREYDRALGADFDLAQQAPALDYDPNDESELPIGSGGRFRQGLVAGRRDILADAMIRRDPGEPARSCNFGELERALVDGEAMRSACAPLTAILKNFAPRERPVFWRIVVLQALLARIILEALEPRKRPLHLRRTLEDILADAKWREAHAIGDAAAEAGHYEAVSAYLGPKLGAIARRYVRKRR
jgi:hypothetical protein